MLADFLQMRFLGLLEYSYDLRETGHGVRPEPTAQDRIGQQADDSYGGFAVGVFPSASPDKGDRLTLGKQHVLAEVPV